MNPRRNAIAAWDFSRWFAVLSPLIGVLLGFVGAFFVLHWKERIWDECNRSQTLSREWQEHTAERFIRSGAPNGPPYHKAWFHWTRHRHDPMLVFNMLVFNSAKVRECIFDSFAQRENVWL